MLPQAVLKAVLEKKEELKEEGVQEQEAREEE